jgi:hypothetical protein
LLQSSGVGVQFLTLGSDPSGLPFGEDATEEFDDVDPEYRIAFRKLTKREANTCEKVGFYSLTELILYV